MLMWNFKMSSFYVGRELLNKNISKIQYISVADLKVYKVNAIDFHNQMIEATETESIADIPEDEVFPVEELGEFQIRLINNDGNGDVVDFMEWISTHIMCV